LLARSLQQQQHHQQQTHAQDMSYMYDRVLLATEYGDNPSGGV